MRSFSFLFSCYRYNVTYLENWVRDNGLKDSGAAPHLEPVVQTCQLLQAKKRADSDEDADSLLDMCSRLSISQMVKILNLYAPVNDFEERVPVGFIRRLQERFQRRLQLAPGLSDEQRTELEQQHAMLLMNTKPNTGFTFYFKPSSVPLESIALPPQISLAFLRRI